MDKLECVLVLTLILHDAGWVTRWPVIGVPAMFAGVCLQAYIVRSKEKAASLMLEGAVLVWVVGNFIWTLCEFMWEEDQPVGFLKNIAALSNWDAEWYPVGMRLAIGIMAFACVWMVIFHIFLLATTVRRNRRRAASRGQQAGFGGPCDWRRRTSPLVEGEEDDEGDDEAEAPLSCMPLSAYFDLFLLPWIFMDTSWAVCNLRAVLGIATQRSLLGVSTFLGVVACATLCDCVRRSVRNGEEGAAETAFYLAELVWVAGNVVWMVGDVLSPDRHLSGGLAAALFLLGALLCLFSLARIARRRRAGVRRKSE